MSGEFSFMTSHLRGGSHLADLARPGWLLFELISICGITMDVVADLADDRSL